MIHMLRNLRRRDNSASAQRTDRFGRTACDHRSIGFRR
jgi:hypothetical protein